MRIDRETCTDYARSSKLEWLETNGTGGFAMGTVAGANTRRYHGLLVASLRPPVDRHVLLSKLEEEVNQTPLGVSQYPGTLAPEGFRHLTGFRLDPFPVWSYEAGGVRIEKKLFLVERRQSVVIQYQADWTCRLRVRPFLAYRDYHSLSHANSSLDGRTIDTGSSIEIRPYAGMPALALAHSPAAFEAGGGWYHNTEYLEELDRGLDFREDLYTPGSLVFELGPATPAWIVATIERAGAYDAGTIRELETAERERRRPQSRDPFVARLLAAADQFRARRADGKPTIMAGYPWFTDWGRDTMIALPGVLIARGLLDEARQVIQGFLDHLNQGLIPNRFPDRGEQPEYNTADGTLWMFQAVYAYEQAGGDAAFFYPAAKEIIGWHERGTHHRIGVDPADGLLAAGGPGSQLTWMDAMVGDWVVTPRDGKPVEINALWYNALKLMEKFARQASDSAAPYTRAARRVKQSFAKAFWNPQRNCLYDRIGADGPDPTLRPNQIFAVSLPFPLLDKKQQQAVVKTVEQHLLTPVGLRTLAPGEEGYRPRYEGDPWRRDGAYHQGTVWPWLLGAFVAACLNAFGRSKKNLDSCRRLVRGMESELERGCLGSIAEICDADPPHRPAGTAAQAWSVAGLITALAALDARAPWAKPGRERR